MNDNSVRIHVNYQGRRTTVSIHPHLFALVALYKKLAPDSNEAHKGVRERCQRTIDRLESRGKLTGGQLSHLLTAELIDVIATPKVLERYDEWTKGAGRL